jgi:hypothetical protein
VSISTISARRKINVLDSSHRAPLVGRIHENLFSTPVRAKYGLPQKTEGAAVVEVMMSIAPLPLRSRDSNYGTTPERVCGSALARTALLMRALIPNRVVNKAPGRPLATIWMERHSRFHYRKFHFGRNVVDPIRGPAVELSECETAGILGREVIHDHARDK